MLRHRLTRIVVLFAAIAATACSDPVAPQPTSDCPIYSGSGCK